jgi:uncharacterized protein YndB with AHSA1/START domain
VPSIKHYLIIKTSPQKVYSALTTKEGISNWWTKEAEIGNRIGDINIFKFGNRYYNEMKITDLKENHFVEWVCEKGDKEWIGTEFTFELEEKNGETILRFAHSNWEEETDFFASCNFQWAHYMKSLRQYCEDGKGMPFNL